MKNLFFVFFLCMIGYNGNSQAVIADPAVNVMRVSNISEVPLDPLLIPINTIVELKIPVINYNTSNSIPPGSCKIKIGLGSKFILDPLFILSNAPTSNYFNWTSEIVGGQVLVTGDLYNTLPNSFNDTLVLRVSGSVLGTSTVTTNFLVTNHNTSINLSDENGNNNNTALSYNIVTGAVPVDFTGVNIAKEQCNFIIDFFTANEINVDRFEIEGSKDGRNFEIIGTLNASQLGHYHIVVGINEEMESRQYFIRIKSVDIDQDFKYSNIYLVNASCNETLTYVIYPNPSPVSSSELKIRGNNGLFNGNYTVTILDLLGKTIQTKIVSGTNNSEILFDHRLLPAGQYMLSIQNKDERPAFLRFQKL